MRQPAETLETFYVSRIGQLAAELVRQRLQDLWGPCSQYRMLGLGYPAPLLSLWQDQALSCVGAVPAGFADIKMVQKRGQSLTRVGEHRLPFRESVFDRIVLLHALEEADNPRHLLREAWRVLAPEGRILIATANRKSLWSLDESKPFGHGRPWTRQQLSRFLDDCLFQVTASTTAVHMPPLNWPLITAAANSWERAGEAFLPGLGGVVLVEAVKHLHARPGGSAHAPQTQTVTAKRTQPILPHKAAGNDTHSASQDRAIDAPG